MGVPGPERDAVAARGECLPAEAAGERERHPARLDAGKTWTRVYEGPNRGAVRLPSAYFAHARHARVRVMADDGFNQTTARSGVFRSLGAAPIVRILEPTKGTIRPQDATLLL